ncbi:MAG TPA: VWA domain-containing protein [Acidobacteriaceae bacterium]|nr:VWA domain-containing protein [Acidobacteriaceae bacterium]
MRFAWIGALCVLFAGAAIAQSEPAVPNAPAPQAQQTPPPNAPAPQSNSSDSLKSLTSGVTPGIGAGAEAAPGQATPPANGGAPAAQQGPPPDYVPPTTVPPPGQGASEITTIHIPVNAVEVPVVVRDKHNHLVSGLPDWRFRIYEDGVLQHPWYFSTDALPLSVAFVIDATLPADVMQKVNQSLSAVAGALVPSDSVAVITYSGTGPDLITNFTGAAGNRLPAALVQAQRPGQEMGVPSMGDDPMTAGPTVNGQLVDPTLAPEHGNANGFVNLPKEIHPLNDAILFAAEQLSSQPRGRRRIIYVVSDGKNVRSKASQKEVLQYLLQNNIAVYGTEVGDASLWGIGYLDRAKLPFLKPENVLPRYALMTGGDLQAELSENGIQNAFVAITESVRGAYTFIYNSHQPTISGKYHNIDVRVEGLPGLTVDAKQGYYPSASGND